MLKILRIFTFTCKKHKSVENCSYLRFYRKMYKFVQNITDNFHVKESKFNGNKSGIYVFIKKQPIFNAIKMNVSNIFLLFNSFCIKIIIDHI